MNGSAVVEYENEEEEYKNGEEVIDCKLKLILFEWFSRHTFKPKIEKEENRFEFKLDKIK